MGLPQPAVALDNICSTVYNNTLYTYSASAFQALPLTAGAKWKQLPYGESVTGGVCVGTSPADLTQAGFFVVGGKAVTAGYPGLQKYTYATGQWSTLTPQSLITQDRLHHGAVYLSAYDKIFMYAGMQDGSSTPSQETFVIQASPPYAVDSIPSTAPPTVDPIVLAWSSSEAAVIGGSTFNTQVMLCDPATGHFVDSGATLLTPLTSDTSVLQAAIVDGDDNSKNLYTFNVAMSPNQVSRIVLVDGTGAPVQNAGPVKRSLGDVDGRDGLEEWDVELIRRSSLTVSNWPAYNASLAPTNTRTDFSIAEGADGMIVLAGGGGTDVLCVFDGRKNSWRNATQMLAQKQVVQTTSSTSSTRTTSKATSSPTTLLTATSASTTALVASASSTPAVAASSAPSLSANALLGIVLGSVAGLGVLLILLYVCIKHHRKRKDFQDAAHSRRASGTSSSEKDVFAIANDSYTQRSYGGKGTFRGGHQAQDSQGSFSSVAILMGRVNQPKQPEPSLRSNNGGPKRGSASSLFNKGFKGTISRPIPQRPEPISDAAPRQMQFERGAGAGVGIGAGAAAAATGAYGRSVTDPKPAVPQQQQPGNDALRQGSTRRSSGWNRYWSGGSALNILGFGSGNANGNGHMSRNSKRTTAASDASSNYSINNQNRITQDSATVPPLDIPGIPDTKPRFQRVNSGSPTIANYDNYIKDGIKGTIERPHSRNSSHSGYSSGIPASVHDTWDPTSANSDRPWGADRAPNGAYGPAANTYNSTPLAPASASSGKKSYVPTGMSRQPQLAMADTSSDMSWLNLGDVSSSRV